MKLKDAKTGDRVVLEGTTILILNVVTLDSSYRAMCAETYGVPIAMDREEVVSIFGEGAIAHKEECISNGLVINYTSRREAEVAKVIA